jgi:hypothetical protein
MNTFVFSLLIGAVLAPQAAQAADFAGTIKSVVAGIIQILQIAAMGYLAKNAYDYARNRPDAADKMPATIFGIVALIGISAVWAWLEGKVR